MFIYFTFTYVINPILQYYYFCLNIKLSSHMFQLKYTCTCMNPYLFPSLSEGLLSLSLKPTSLSIFLMPPFSIPFNRASFPYLFNYSFPQSINILKFLSSKINLISNLSYPFPSWPSFLETWDFLAISIFLTSPFNFQPSTI